MRIKFILVFTIIAFAASAQEKINKGFKTFKVLPSRKLVLHSNDSFSFRASIEKGNALVFEYFNQADEYSDMTDDEFAEKILFELPGAVDSFELTGASLKAAYLRSCFCVDRGWHRVKDGLIRGKKAGAKAWNVEISVNTEKEPDRSTGPIGIDVQGKFILQPLPKPVKKVVRKPAAKKAASKKVMILKKK